MSWGFSKKIIARRTAVSPMMMAVPLRGCYERIAEESTEDLPVLSAAVFEGSLTSHLVIFIFFFV